MSLIVITPEELKAIVYSAVREAIRSKTLEKSKSVMTPAEAAAYIGKKETTLRKWRSLKQGPEYSKSSTGAIYYRRDVLDTWLAEHQVRTKDGVSYAF